MTNTPKVAGMWTRPLGTSTWAARCDIGITMVCASCNTPHQQGIKEAAHPLRATVPTVRKWRHLGLYTDKGRLFVTSRPAQPGEELERQSACAHFARGASAEPRGEPMADFPCHHWRV